MTLLLFCISKHHQQPATASNPFHHEDCYHHHHNRHHHFFPGGYRITCRQSATFIDDIFALGLLLNSADLIDMQLVLGTSEQPELSATCIAAQIKMSGMEGMVPVAMGEELPPYEDRGSVCGYVVRWSV